MSDEFDEIPDLPRGSPASRIAPSGPSALRRGASRLVARLYVAADNPLRARLLASLIKPIGPLGIAGVAAGAFAWAVQRGAHFSDSAVERAARITGDQVSELARFAEQVDPQALVDFAALAEGSHLGVAGLSAAAVVLLYGVIRARPSSRQASADATGGARTHGVTGSGR